MTKTKEQKAKEGILLSDKPRQRNPRAAGMRSFDAAATTAHNENHWLYADASDADFWIRQDLPTVRNRARYEIKNNSYGEGIVETLVTEIVGDGPDLQFNSGEGADADEEVELKFYLWMLDCDIEGRQSFGEMLQLVGVRQQCDSGEGLISLVNGKAEREWTKVRPEPLLRLRAIEPDRLSSPYGLAIKDDKIRDGIEYDNDGRPAFYYILKQHPGAAYNLGLTGDYDRVPASQVIHFYRLKRAGQSRGMPWITPALPLFANMRRFTLATIQNAESIANTTGTMEAEPTGEDTIEPMDEVELPRNALLTLPPGRKMNTVKPEHPATTYKMFKAEIINEIARCVNMPYNLAAANSSEYNYASGRLDHKSFNKFKRTVRGCLERKIINRTLFAWLREGLLIPGFFKYYKGTNLATTMPQWNWPGDEHVDPQKEANGQDKRLSKTTTNLQTEYSLQGKDWKPEITQRGKEVQYAIELAQRIKKETNVTVDWRIFAGIDITSSKNGKTNEETNNEDEEKNNRRAVRKKRTDHEDLSIPAGHAR